MVVDGQTDEAATPETQGKHVGITPVSTPDLGGSLTRDRILQRSRHPRLQEGAGGEVG